MVSNLQKNNTNETPQDFGPLHGTMQVEDEDGKIIDIDLFCKHKKEKIKQLERQFALEANLCAGRNKI